nr:hypothetical protein [uncultured Agathobaculum sp.]
MSERPILMNTDMVRAILEGRKTVTRRVVKLKYENTHLEMRTDKYGTRLIEVQNEEPGVTTVKNPDGTTTHRLLACIEKEPPYKLGDILWVRETWCESLGQAGKYFYRAYAGPRDEMKEYAHSFNKWRPSIHMPREAARIFLRVTDVRVERLQDCGNMQAKDEGCTCSSQFARLWDSTVKPADRATLGWEANPWVWVISFERISKDEAPLV